MDFYQFNMYVCVEVLTYLCGLDWQAENSGDAKTVIYTK